METPGSRNMVLGLLWFAGGGLVTWLTWEAATGGGYYVVAYGAIVGGALQFIVGISQYLRYRAAAGS
jgi:hypothetical protein